MIVKGNNLLTVRVVANWIGDTAQLTITDYADLAITDYADPMTDRQNQLIGRHWQNGEDGEDDEEE